MKAQHGGGRHIEFQKNVIITALDKDSSTPYEYDY